MGNMITNFFLILVYYALLVLTSPLMLLSDVSADSSVVTSISTAVSYIATWNQILPLAAVFSVVGSIIAIEVIIASYKVIMWVLRRVPTQS